MAPFFWGRADAAAQAQHAADRTRRNDAAAQAYAPGGYRRAGHRGALGRLAAPVLVVAGEYDLSLPPASAHELAAHFPHGEVVVQPGAAHSPWLDDPAWFVWRCGASWADGSAPRMTAIAGLAIDGSVHIGGDARACGP